MTVLRLAAVAINQTPLDWGGNRQRIERALFEARGAGARLACLPELCLTGYGCGDWFLAPHVRQRALEELARLLPSTRGLVALVGAPIEIDRVVYNAMAILADGAPLGFVCKQHLAGDGIHYEPRWFRPWPAGEVTTARLLGEDLPVGDLTFDFAGVRVGVEVCRDAWVEERPAKVMAERGVGLLLNPSASHFAFDKQKHREGLVLEGAKLIDGVCVFTNLLGNESGRSIYEGGMLAADPKGLIAEGPRFSFSDHITTVLDVEIADRPLPTLQGPIAKQPAAEGPAAEGPAAEDPAAEDPALGGLVESRFSLAIDSDPALEHATPLARPAKHEDFARAVALGLFDYLRKSGSKGFVLSLSGGADSAAVALLVALMREYSTAELGVEQAAERLGMAEPLLTTVYQATTHSSATTREAAAEIARCVGAQHHEWQVDALVQQHTRLVSGALDRPLDWQTDDHTLQNIQARVRAPGVWMLANARNALLLATGNRSESSVGYCTMDGDTAGGLAPIAGVDKAYLLEWLRWLESEGPVGIGPFPQLARITEQQPTAELRPSSEGQTDESDLMPYAVLDVIERALVADRCSPEEALGRLTTHFPEHDRDQLSAWIDRFARLWRLSQWKRERLAPSFHLDTHNVDPKTWARFPILSGPFLGVGETQ